MEKVEHQVLELLKVVLVEIIHKQNVQLQEIEEVVVTAEAQDTMLLEVVFLQSQLLH